MKLYWCPQTRSVRALWLMEESGMAYQPVKIDIRSATGKSDAGFQAASPMGKVPALEDGTVRIWDSGAICGYVADQYPAKGLAPAIGHPDRGAYLMWLMFTNSVIEPAMSEKVSGLTPNPVRNGWGSFELMLNTLRKGLERGPWILGDLFSAADIMVGSSCDFMRRFKMITDEPVLFAYADRCAARPAFQRAQKIESGG